MKIMLFTTPTCQYCPPAKELLTEVKEVLYLNAQDNIELAKQYGVRSVPTLVIEKCSGNKVYVGIDEIKEFVDGLGEEEEHQCGCGHK